MLEPSSTRQSDSPNTRLVVSWVWLKIATAFWPNLQSTLSRISPPNKITGPRLEEVGGVAPEPELAGGRYKLLLGDSQGAPAVETAAPSLPQRECQARPGRIWSVVGLFLVWSLSYLLEPMSLCVFGLLGGLGLSLVQLVEADTMVLKTSSLRNWNEGGTDTTRTNLNPVGQK